MAISIGANFSYNGKLFIDDRQGLAKTKSELKNWDLVVPEGFEVFLESDKEWYMFGSDNNDPETGKFVKRNGKNDGEFDRVDQEIGRLDGEINRVDEELNDIRTNIDTVESTIQQNYNTLDQKIDGLEDKVDGINTALGDRIDETNELLDSTIQDIETRHSVIYADTKNDLTIESNWVINGKSYVKTGIIVSVINDGENNGVYQLKDLDYKNINNWKKILDIEDLITSEDNTTESTDNNIYSAKKTDSKFIRKDVPETITQPWNFQEPIATKEINLGENDKKIYVDQGTGEAIVDVDKIVAKTSELEDLPIHIWENTDIGVINLLRNSGFNGEYDSLELGPEKGLFETTEMYNQQYQYWEGYGSWEIVEEPAAISGFGVKMIKSDSYLEQKVRSELFLQGQSYTMSFKAKGNITAYVNGNTISCTSSEYNLYKIRFNYTKSQDISVRFTGQGNICDIKLERGNVSTDWTRSDQDSDPVKNKFQDLEYLRTAFGDENGNMTSGFVLKNVMQIGENSNEDSEIKGGISGIYSKTNTFIWSGSTLKNANRAASLVENIKNDPEIVKNSGTNLFITYDGKIYADKIIARSIYSIEEDLEKNIKKQEIELSTKPNGSSSNGSTQNFIIDDLDIPILILAKFNFRIGAENYTSAITEIKETIVPSICLEKELHSPIYVKQSGLLEDDLYLSWTLVNVENNNYKINFTLDYGERTTIYSNISNFTVDLDGKIHIIQL